MRFLIDECLHPTLATVAQNGGYEAHHVNFLGLSSTRDRDLMPRILDDGFVFVTNNAVDFRRLYRTRRSHPGLIVFVPQAPPKLQRLLFERTLDEIRSTGALDGQALEIFLDGDMVRFERYAWPEISSA